MAVTPEERAKYAKRRYKIAKTWERGVAAEKERRAQSALSKRRHSAKASQASLKLSTRKRVARKPTETKSQRIARFKRAARKRR